MHGTSPTVQNATAVTIYVNGEPLNASSVSFTVSLTEVYWPAVDVTWPDLRREKWEASHAAIVARRLAGPPRPVALASSIATSSRRTSRSARSRRARSRAAFGRAHPVNRAPARARMVPR